MDGIKGPFTRTISVPVSVTVTVKVYHYTNGDGPFDRQIEFDDQFSEFVLLLSVRNPVLPQLVLYCRVLVVQVSARYLVLQHCKHLGD